MFPKINSNNSFRNTFINKHYTTRNIKKNNNNIISSKSLKNINNNLSTKSNSIFQNSILKDKTDNLETKINGGILNKKKYNYSNSKVLNTDYNNKSISKKTKENNVTNNICIIIKTSENPDKENEDDVNDINEKNISKNLGYYDSFISKKNNKNQFPIDLQTKKINFDLKSNNFKNKNIENNKIKLKRFNNSFIIKNNKLKNTNNIMTKTKSTNYKINNYQKRTKIIKNKPNDSNNNNIEIIKYRYQNKNSSILNSKNKNYYTKRKIPSVKKRNLFNSPDEENGGYSKEILNTEVLNRNTTKYLDNMTYSPLNKNRTSYKDLIQQKKKSLGIILNKREKKKIKNELFISPTVNYDKQIEEIEKEILLNDEIIKNEVNNIDNNNKKGLDRRIFSSDLSKITYLTNSNLDPRKDLNKINNKNNINLINNKINNSKIEINYTQTESNKDDNKKNINLNIFMNANTKYNIKYKKRNINRNNDKINCRKSFNSIKSINSINSNKSLKSVHSDNRNNILNTSSNSLFNTSKSCINMLIKKSKMKRNISLILHDIKKLLNKSKNDKDNKEANKSPKKSHSIQKNGILMLNDNENGKTFHCITKLSKDKVQEEIQIKKIEPEKDIEEEASRNITGLLKNIKKRVLKYNDNYKNLEIKIPGREIEALRRIKARINTYQKTQKINRNRSYKYVKIQKFKSFSYFHVEKMYNKIYLYKTKKSNSVKIKHKNEYSIFYKLKFY